MSIADTAASNHRPARAALLVMILATGACDSAETSATRIRCVSDSLVEMGVAVAFTPADDPGAWAREGRGSPRFVELWRAGGLNEGQALGFPLSPSLSSAGRLAIADWELANITLVDPDGTWHGDWARPGQGPGEIMQAAAVAWVGDADSLTVFDIGNGKVEQLAEAGPLGPSVRVRPEYLGPIVESGSARWLGVTPDGAVLLAPDVTRGAPSEGGVPSSKLSMLLLAAGAEHTDTLVAVVVPNAPDRPRRSALSAPGWAVPVAAVSYDGDIYVGGDGAGYRIAVFDGSGRLSRLVCRAATGLPLGARELSARTDEDRDLEERFASAVRPDIVAPFGRLFVSVAGDLWVQRERPSLMGFAEEYQGVPGALYDVFDSDGAYLGEVRAPDNARLQAALGDTVWAFEIGELDETWVVAYELRWD